MELSQGVRDRIDGWASYFGPKADDPIVAAKLIGGGDLIFCLVFSALVLFLHFTREDSGITTTSNSEMILYVLIFTAAGVVSAVVSTLVVWRYIDFSGVWKYRRGVGGGLAAALLTHIIYGFAFSIFFTIVTVIGFLAENGGIGPLLFDSISEFINWISGVTSLSLSLGLYSIFGSFGIPTLISVGVGLWLTYARSKTGV